MRDRDQYLAVNHFAATVRALVNEILDCGLEDESEAALKLDAIVGEASTLRTLARRLADERAERMSEPYDSGWVADFNRGQRE